MTYSANHTTPRQRDGDSEVERLGTSPVQQRVETERVREGGGEGSGREVIIPLGEYGLRRGREREEEKKASEK